MLILTNGSVDCVGSVDGTTVEEPVGVCNIAGTLIGVIDGESSDGASVSESIKESEGDTAGGSDGDLTGELDGMSDENSVGTANSHSTDLFDMMWSCEETV